MDTENAKNCHCDLWEKDPQTLKDQGIPKGYCGICEFCQKPGHTMTHPGRPCSVSWCDQCQREYMEGAISLPLGQIFVLILIALAAYWWWKG